MKIETALLMTVPLAVFACALQGQNTVYVGGSRPGSIPDLQTAVAQAVPGDTLLIDGYLSLGAIVNIDKSLTIRSAPGVRGDLIMVDNGGGILITALTPGIALRIEGIDLSYIGMDVGFLHGIRSLSSVTGDIQFHGVNARLYTVGGFHATTLVELTGTRVFLKNCSFYAPDQGSDAACIDSRFWGTATSCLRVQAQMLVMEECDLTAASAGWLTSHPTNCFGCDPSGSYSQTAPPGGFALLANTQASWIVRTRTRDGNGGNGQQSQPPCGSIAGAGQAGLSMFTGPGGTLHAFDFIHQQGVPGVQTNMPPSPTRGPLLTIGDATAPLRLLGNAQLGGGIQANVSEPGISLLAMAFAWSPTNTPIGRIAFDPLQEHFTFLVFTPTPPSTQSWNVPNDPFLSGLPIVTQLFPFDPTSGAWRAANPSAITLRRP